MRIVHITGYFVEEMSYQENLLPVGQHELGHEVIILTGINNPDFGFNSSNRTNKILQFIYKGVKVIRLNHYIELNNKGPILKDLYGYLKKLNPDVLFVHDIGTSLLTALLYKIWFPNVILQFDSHSTIHNSRTSFIGPLYHYFYKVLFQIFRNRFDSIFAVAPETVDFMNKYYGFDVKDIKLLPLPGDNQIIKRYHEIRFKIREELKISQDEIVIIHTGKLPGDKDTTRLLEAFVSLNKKITLLISGYAEPGYMEVIQSFIDRDSRIRFMGWSNNERLRELFVASDLLVQPGSLSNTFNDAICCHLPVLLDKTPQGAYLTSFGNGKLVRRGDIGELANMIDICTNRAALDHMKNNSKNASEFLDYRNNAKMSLEGVELHNSI